MGERNTFGLRQRVRREGAISGKGREFTDDIRFLKDWRGCHPYVTAEEHPFP